MKKRFFFILLLALLFTSILFILFKTKKTTYLNVWIIDKTVQTNDFREHKGLIWLLNNMKIKNKLTQNYFDYAKEYFGFYPNLILLNIQLRKK